MNQLFLTIEENSRNIETLIRSNPEFHRKIQQIQDAKLKEILIGVDLCVDDDGKKNYLFNEINQISTDLNTKFNRVVLLMLEYDITNFKSLKINEL